MCHEYATLSVNRKFTSLVRTVHIYAQTYIADTFEPNFKRDERLNGSEANTALLSLWTIAYIVHTHIDETRTQSSVNEKLLDSDDCQLTGSQRT